MKKKSVFLIVALLLLSFNTSLAYILDTGTPSGGTSSWQLARNQNIAGQFALTDSYSISSIQGYMGYALGSGMNLIPGSVTLRIYGNSSSNLPDINNVPIYSTSFNVSGFSGYQWCGPSALALVLDPGTYWAVFGAPGDSFFGYMVDGAPNPLARYAQIYNSSLTNTTDVGAFEFDTGFRINGSLVTTPEPATMLLFGLGVVGLAGVRRFKS